MTDCVAAESAPINAWGVVDMARLPRMRSFVQLCLPPLLARLEASFPVTAMRRRGVTQVMYYLDFEHNGVPLALGEPLHVDHCLRMHRTDEPGGGHVFWHSENRIEGRRYAPGTERDGHPAAAGVGRTIHVLTRPSAPPGERAVCEVPRELEGLTAHPWDGGLPRFDDLQAIPAGFQRSERAPEQDYIDVWGVPNTDTNRHVNVLEYIIGFENQTTRHLHAAGLDVRRHRIARMRALFRKPSFPGEAYAIASTLHQRGGNTLLTAAFHHRSPDGEVSPRPAVAAVVEGYLALPGV